MNKINYFSSAFRISVLVLILNTPLTLWSQNSFTRADTLRGSNGNMRNWWNALHYDITIKPVYEQQKLSGKVLLTFFTQKEADLMQIDLQGDLKIDSAFLNGTFIKSERIGATAILNIKERLKQGSTGQLMIYYSGKPDVALNAPWDGGFIWSKDSLGRPWISVACEHKGASCWFPCKDFEGDKPDSGVSLHYIVPEDLVAVGNGALKSVQNLTDKEKQFNWEVKSPVNLYNVAFYAGYYKKLDSSYKGENGILPIRYWFLDYRTASQLKQFAQVKKVINCFEYWFGEYPFYKDGYQIVEAPFLGMEHQSAIAYGNGYKNGYRGTDLSKSGVGLEWDFIIVHESAHEWWGNRISAGDIADLWIHEAFASYSETLFSECFQGKEKALKYLYGCRSKIKNDSKIIGFYGVNNSGSGDMYYKGANLIHFIRLTMNNDSLFRKMLRDLQQAYAFKPMQTEQVESFIQSYCQINIAPLFDQYLRTRFIPKAEFRKLNGNWQARWLQCVDNFNVPVRTQNGVELSFGVEWTPLHNWKDSNAPVPDEGYLIEISAEQF